MSIADDLAGLTPDALRDLARNHAARLEYRKAAAQILADTYHRHRNHPEVAVLLTYRGYGQPSEPTPDEPAPEISPESGQGPFRASFTTENLMQDDAILDLDEEADGEN